MDEWDFPSNGGGGGNIWGDIGGLAERLFGKWIDFQSQKNAVDAYRATLQSQQQALGSRFLSPYQNPYGTYGTVGWSNPNNQGLLTILLVGAGAFLLFKTVK